MITGNKGEWSEIYTFLKLLAEGKLYSGDADLKKIPDLFYPIIKILRDEKTSSLEFKIDDVVVIVSETNEGEIIKLPITHFRKQAELLFKRIKSNSGSFSVPEVELFMQSMGCYQLKAKPSIASYGSETVTETVHSLAYGPAPFLN